LQRRHGVGDARLGESATEGELPAGRFANLQGNQARNGRFRCGSRTEARRVARLDDEIIDDAVKDDAVVKALLDEIDEVAARVRGVRPVDRNFDRRAVNDHRDGDGFGERREVFHGSDSSGG